MKRGEERQKEEGNRAKQLDEQEMDGEIETRGEILNSMSARNLHAAESLNLKLRGTHDMSARDIPDVVEDMEAKDREAREGDTGERKAQC